MKRRTFNVWVKDDGDGDFLVCSKKIIYNQSRNRQKLIPVAQDDDMVNSGATICGCDVALWLETLDMEEDEVKSFKLTFTEGG